MRTSLVRPHFSSERRVQRSVAVSIVAWVDQVPHGHGFPRWTSFRLDSSAFSGWVCSYDFLAPARTTTRLAHQSMPGLLADNSKSRFGRRRPYMIGGSLLCALSMLLLGYTRSVSSIVTPPGSVAVRVSRLHHCPFAQSQVLSRMTSLRYG